MRLAIVSPCYNEEELIKDSSIRLNEVVDNLITKDKISSDSFILFVNDGSTDKTWEEIIKMHSDFPRVCGMALAGNVGHQSAIMAGMMSIRTLVDAIITIDSDLQDDTNAIETMIDEHLNGADVVYGIKTDRRIDPWYKKLFAQLFYKIQGLLGVKSIKDHADFRLMSRKVLDTLATYPERNIYLRGIIPLMGFKSIEIADTLSPRIKGESKYIASKQLHLAIDGITSFSTKPLEHIFVVGAVMMVIALLMFAYVVVSMVIGHVIAGWASIMISIWFIGAVLTMGMGLIGIYIGKIFMEVKQRPLYRIVELVGIKIDEH